MVKGLYQNTNPDNIPKDYAWYAKNIISNRLLDSSINEKGNVITISGLSEYSIDFFIGVAIYGNDIIFAYKTTDNRDQILLYNETTGSKTIKLDRDDFNFNKDYPLDIEVKENQKGELILAITDDLNPPRYVNLEDTTRDINYYSLFPIFYNPSNMEVEIIDSGSVVSGAYIVYIQYITSDRTRSQFSIGSNPIYINNDEEGINSNQSTNKLIKVTLKDVDTTYEKIAIAVLSKINGVISSKVIKEIFITGETLSFVYNGNEFLYDISLDTLLEIQPVYNKAKHITSINDQLLLADLETDEVINYQDVANAFVIDWLSAFDTVNKVATTNKYKNGLNKTFMHDEVYALYAQFELEGGRFTDWYHIPGRELTPAEKATYPIENIKINNRDPYFYEIKDTCGIPQDLGTSNGIVSKFGTMGAWENTNETYPDGYGALAGQRIRHHKFPSIEFMAKYAYDDQAGYGVDNIDRLGLKISNTLLFTPSYSKIIGYRIGYAKRTLSDLGVIGLGLSIFGASPSTNDGISEDTNTLMSAAGNFNIVCLNGNPDDIRLNRNYLRFNSFDIWQDRPAVNNSYLRNYIRLTANALASSHPNYAGGSTYGQIHPGSGSFDMVAYASNFTLQGTYNTLRGGVTPGDEIRKLSNQKYIPNHIKIFEDSIVINNLGCEETLFAKVEGTNLSLPPIGQLETDTNNSVDDPTMAEQVYLSALKNPKSDFFLGFENQTIVTNPTIFRSFINQNFLIDLASNGSFDNGLTNWSQTAGDAWVNVADNIECTVNTPTTDSAIIYQDGYEPNKNYVINLNITKTLGTTPFIVFLDNANTPLSVIAIGASGNITINAFSPTNTAKIGFKFSTSLDPGTVTIDDVKIQTTEATTFNSIYNGDSFVGVYSYAMITAYNKNVDVENTEFERVVNFKIHINIGRHNVNYRYLNQGDYTSYFYPDAGKFTLNQNEVDKYWFYQHSRKAEWNQFLYSKDFSLINDLETYGIYNPTGLNESNYPYRIIRSGKPNTESFFEDGWRSFKPLDYYDTLRTKGLITNLEAWGDILLIHHRDALFRTRDKAVLKSTEALNIQLGSGDLFEIEPQEQNPTEYGYAGTQHKFACLVTDIGYIFTDASRGEVFLFNGQLNNITKGFKNFFNTYLDIAKDNPINDEGISVAYDQRNYRILLSLKATNSFTLSYDIIKQEWSSFHDYKNTYLFNSKRNLYSIDDIDLYKHGFGNYGEFYGIKYPSFIDIVVNEEPTKEKVISSVNWITRVFNNSTTIQKDKTITHITVYNDLYTTGRIQVITNSTTSLFADLTVNTKLVDGVWSFNDIYNKVKDYPFLRSITEDYLQIDSALENPKWFESEPIRGKYFVIRLEYDNLEENEVNLINADALIRLSKS
jgi:hypothetical protein